MVVHSVVVPIADTSTQRPIELGCHNIHTGFDQSPRQQALLPPLVSAVPVAEFIGLILEVEGLLGITAGQK